MHNVCFNSFVCFGEIAKNIVKVNWNVGVKRAKSKLQYHHVTRHKKKTRDAFPAAKIIKIAF